MNIIKPRKIFWQQYCKWDGDQNMNVKIMFLNM